MSELKPCPFCGNEAKFHDGSIKDACFCPNHKCLLFARLLDIKLWNRRPIEDKLESDLAAAREVLIVLSPLDEKGNKILFTLDSYENEYVQRKMLDWINQRTPSDLQILSGSYYTLAQIVINQAIARLTGGK